MYGNLRIKLNKQAINPLGFKTRRMSRLELKPVCKTLENIEKIGLMKY